MSYFQPLERSPRSCCSLSGNGVARQVGGKLQRVNMPSFRLTSQVFLDLQWLLRAGETGASCNSFYSSPCSAKSVEYRKFFFISLGSPLVALERDIFKLAKDCLMNGKVEHKWACYNQGWMSDMGFMIPPLSQKVAIFTNLGQGLSSKVGLFLIF